MSAELTSMQAPVTQSTRPERIRQPAWYFLRERGMNCSRMVRAKVGKTPTEPWGVPSELCKPKPMIPGGPSGLASWISMRPKTWPRKPLAISTSGLSTKSQGLRASRQPVFTPAAKPSFCDRTTSRSPDGGFKSA